MSTATDRYLSAVQAGLDDIAATMETVTVAAERLAACIVADGIVHLFGSGHSAMLAQELFHRAGGLVPFNAMLDINLSIFGTAHATRLERLEGYAPAILTNHNLVPGDALIVISTSGINPVPIELAIEARDRGACVIGVTSVTAYRDALSRHSSGMKLVDVVDLVLNTQVPEGDAAVPIGTARVGALSTVLGGTLLNLLVVETARLLDEQGHPIPAFVSQNVPGGDEHNAALIERYAHRLPLMKP